MADYIKRDSVLNTIHRFRGYIDEDMEWRMKFAINKIPSADVAEVKHGEWICYPECLRYMNAYAADHIVCSVCEECFSILDNDTERFDYCPHCGARMDGE